MTSTEHTLRTMGTSQVGPTHQGAGKRTVSYGYCTCGMGTTNSANGESVRRKIAAHAAGNDRGMVKA